MNIKPIRNDDDRTPLSSGRVSEERPLSLRMIKRLHDGLRIPYESLLSQAHSI